MLGKKIMIIGCCGSGKSTLAKQLAHCVDLPLIHLDREYYKPNWEKPTKNEWEEKVQSLISKIEWIMDGNYYNTLNMRMEQADTVIFLDINKFSCAFRVIQRACFSKESMRSDMGHGCHERFDMDFFRFVWNFDRTMRPRIYALLKNYSQLNIIVLKSSRDIKKFISEL
ncbi:AAA family ATPase [Clostridium estertheticum]|uniref:AAA family ATPase n=1 Tax=Clostridium estertheticum TaxID=238834 RepID=UPI0013E8FCB9|nr:AAA family ATPase [Clostridium estertheticum]MBZ9687389.1 AAA family ATPase [Clostridium estertheticum]